MTDVCHDCHKPQPDMIKVRLLGDYRFYCEQCWPQHEYFEGRYMWKRKGDHLALIEWKRIGKGFYIERE
jgi:hypothetical protein